VGWMFLTHAQSRFLLPMAVPLAMLMGLGVQGLGPPPGVGGLLVGVLRLLLGIIIVVHSLCTVFLLRPEANFAKQEQVIAAIFENAINLAAIDAKEGEPSPPPPLGLLLEGSTPFYWLGNVTYNSVFDKNELAEHLRAGVPETVEWLRGRGIRYVVFAWPDIQRLRGTYGFDERITPEILAELEAAGFRRVATEIDAGMLTILRVP